MIKTGDSQESPEKIDKNEHVKIVKTEKETRFISEWLTFFRDYVSFLHADRIVIVRAS